MARTALIIVDMQEDFCPPNGSLAVPGGRDIATSINHLLELPFDLIVATRDFHPENHVSFASAHSAPNNVPFVSRATIKHVHDSSRQTEIPLWPDHCVQGTHGVEFIPELDMSKVQVVVSKSRDARYEMFSAFSDVFGDKDDNAVNINLAERLRVDGISNVYITGLAGDYCVKATAFDAYSEGFTVYMVENAIRSIDEGPSGWLKVKSELISRGIHISTTQNVLDNFAGNSNTK